MIKKNNPLPKTNLLIRKRNNQPIKGFVADSAGQFPEIFSLGNFGGTFEFTHVGRQKIIVTADTLTGYNSEVKIKLIPMITHSTYSGTRKYLIKELKVDKMILESLKNSQTIILNRENSFHN